ncbi:MAG: type III pantothenate kinase [Bacteroidales bacterium]|nr:type III pantothenate kinase [Bacteroidales bacterium]
MNLVIDFGNTRCKTYLFNDAQIIENNVFLYESNELITYLLNIVKQPTINGVIISSVTEKFANIAKKIVDEFNQTIILNPTTPLPIKLCYKQRSQLGNDRIAAAVGATVMFPNQNVLVIDAGTAITYEYIQEGTTYLGGNISPGLSMRFASLHEHTSKLPLITASKPTKTPGQTTNEAMNNGVVQGILAEISWYIQRFEQSTRHSAIILTGGDAIFLAEYLKNTIFAVPNLVAIGLNRILQYNVFKEK